MEEIKGRLLEYIQQNDFVTFAELEVMFTLWGFDWKGELELYHAEIPTVIFWTGWNKEAYGLLADLQKRGLIHKEPCEVFLYVLDGQALDCPIVKAYRHYKTTHWLPSVYRPGKGAA